MIKELIRNGGFERGNTDFWETVTAGITLTAQIAEKKRGSYGGMISRPDNGNLVVIQKDYINCAANELFKVTAWLKSPVYQQPIIEVYWYDSDYNYIDVTRVYIAGGVLAAFTLVSEYFTVPEEASYVRIAFFNTSIVGGPGEWYIDSVSLQRIDMEKVTVLSKFLVDVLNITTDDTFYGEEFFTGIWKEAEYTLYCTSLTGTTPTLNVTIQGYDRSTEQWKDVLVFQELAAAGSEFKTVLSGLGWKQRVKYITAGTVTDCDFEVGVVYKR